MGTVGNVCVCAGLGAFPQPHFEKCGRTADRCDGGSSGAGSMDEVGEVLDRKTSWATIWQAHTQLIMSYLVQRTSISGARVTLQPVCNTLGEIP